MELADFDLSATTLVSHLRRAARGHQRYLLTCQAQGVKVDPAVEHQLANHIILLQAIAKASGRDDDQIQADVDQGVAQARSEI